MMLLLGLTVLVLMALAMTGDSLMMMPMVIM